MPRIREVAALLCQLGELKVTQRGRSVDPLTAKGPIRFTALSGPHARVTAFVSDTHGLVDTELIEQLTRLCPEQILHAGDVGKKPGLAQPVLAKLAEVAPVLAVPGNTDGPCRGTTRHVVHKLRLPLLATSDIGGNGGVEDAEVDVRILIVHGNGPALIKNTSSGGLTISTDASDLIKQSQPNLVYFGHSHVPGIGSISRDVWWVNPGSAGPQRFKLARSFGLMRSVPGHTVLSIEGLGSYAGKLYTQEFEVVRGAGLLPR